MAFVKFCLVLLAFIKLSDGFGTNFWKLKNILWENNGDNNLRLANIPENYIDQPLDHFNALNNETYKQRYFVNDQYWRKPDGPVFLYIGGEARLDEARATNDYFHVKAAKKFGALIFAVEHRFYGKSLNDDGLQLQNLHYLSSQQALADLASFHQVMSEKYGLTSSNKWICFGGSYPGSLSAWFRLKYPHLVVGAVSSSSPVHALVDFQGYNDVVATSLGSEIVGGSSECVNSVRKAFEKVDEMLDKQEYDQLSKDFNSCTPLTSNIYDLFTFASNAADIFMGTVQYNNPSSKDINVEKICNIMTSSSDSYQNLLKLLKKYDISSSANCMNISWNDYISSLNNTVIDKPVYENDMRQWTYQTCAQFGYYQTCEEQSKCVFSKRLSLAPSLEICRLVYGITPKKVHDYVDFTNSFYGSDKPHGSNILFVNGLIDPWHALSVLKNLSDTENAIVIPGTSHCADMKPETEKDSLALLKAREMIMTKMEGWLNSDHQQK